MQGVEFSNPVLQKNFRVLFFEEKDVQQYKADFSFLDETMKSEMSPVYKPHSLAFSIKTEYLGMNDVRYEDGPVNITKIAAQYPAIEEDQEELVREQLDYTGHKIGGYAHFTQQDPRYGEPGLKNHLLLLQIDTDEEIMWGDSGVCNLFIHPDELARKDFSKVLYNWDCY